MSFTYSPSIPAANNDPADDQPLMQQNFASTSGLINVDHVGFNTAGGGRHNQVTFDSNNVPAIFPVTPPVLFTDIVANVSQLFFYSGDAAHSVNQYVNTVAPPIKGSTYLLGGIILKWGNKLNASSGPILFASDFPNACLLVIAVSNDTGTDATANTYVYASGWTKSGFNLVTTFRTKSGAHNSDFSYIAIGY